MTDFEWSFGRTFTLTDRETQGADAAGTDGWRLYLAETRVLPPDYHLSRLYNSIPVSIFFINLNFLFRPIESNSSLSAL